MSTNHRTWHGNIELRNSYLSVVAVVLNLLAQKAFCLFRGANREVPDVEKALQGLAMTTQHEVQKLTAA